MQTVATNQRFSNELATPRQLGNLLKVPITMDSSYLQKEFQLLNVERMKEIEGHYKSNIAVIIVASKIHWWMLKWVGEKFRKKQRAWKIRISDLDWTDHEVSASSPQHSLICGNRLVGKWFPSWEGIPHSFALFPPIQELSVRVYFVNTDNLKIF